MSVLGQKQKSRHCGGKSALLPKADIERTFPEVRLVPISDGDVLSYDPTGSNNEGSVP